MRKKKILFYTEAWGLGGIESFVMNTIETLDLSKFSFDIFSTHDWDRSHDQRIKDLGGNRITVFSNKKPNILKRTISGPLAWNDLLATTHYDVVHINTMNGMGFLYSMIAKHRRVPIRVVHSHNSSFGGNGFLERTLKNIGHLMGRKLLGSSATDRIACSKAAGKYLFHNKQFKILQNGIDTDSFAFDSDKRNLIRKQFDIPESALLFGSVGRLTEVKNPFFQIELLAELRKRNVTAYALLVGNGDLEEKLMPYARRCGVERFLRLPGAAQHPADYLSALDVFTMPSLFEGSPFAAIEAFTNGLPVVLSAEVPALFKNSSREIHLPLNDFDSWATEIQKYGINKESAFRKSFCVEARCRGLDRRETTRKLEKIYQKS